MSRFAKPSIRKLFGKIVTETPYNNEWVNAVKFLIPRSARDWNENSGIWEFGCQYYNCVVELTQHFFGSGIIDSTGGMEDTQQDMSWVPRWEQYQQGRQTAKETRKETFLNAKRDPFDVFYLLPSAPSYVIKAVYRSMSAKWHPDVPGGDEAMMVEINRSYNELKKMGKVHG